MNQRWAACVTGLVVVAVSVSACSGSSEGDDPPGLDRIDGPASVDPSFDPFASVPATDGG